MTDPELIPLRAVRLRSDGRRALIAAAAFDEALHEDETAPVADRGGQPPTAPAAATVAPPAAPAPVSPETAKKKRGKG